MNGYFKYHCICEDEEFFSAIIDTRSKSVMRKM